MEFQGHGGITHFGNSKSKGAGRGGGGLKYGNLPLVWYVYFLEMPNYFFLITSKNKQEQDTYILATSIVIEIFCSYFNGKSR